MTTLPTLAQIMRPASLIHQDASVKEAVAMMNSQKTNELLVIDSDGILVGEVSVTDILAAAVPEDFDGDSAVEHFADEDAFQESLKNIADKFVSDCMSFAVESVHADSSLLDVAATAIAMGQARIPVVDSDNRPVGIISRVGLKQILTQFLK